MEKEMEKNQSEEEAVEGKKRRKTRGVLAILHGWLTSPERLKHLAVIMALPKLSKAMGFPIHKHAAFTYSIATFVSAYNIMTFDGEKMRASARYISLLCGDKDMIKFMQTDEKVHGDDICERCLPGQSYTQKALDASVNVISVYSKPTAIFYSMSMALSLFRTGKIHLLDTIKHFVRTMTYLAACPFLFWTIFCRVKTGALMLKFRQLLVSGYIAIAAALALKLERRKRWTAMASFMLSDALLGSWERYKVYCLSVH